MANAKLLTKKEIIQGLTSHIGWEIVEEYIKEQTSTEKFLGLKSWEEYLQTQAEIRALLTFKGTIDEYLNNKE